MGTSGDSLSVLVAHLPLFCQKDCRWKLLPKKSREKNNFGAMAGVGTILRAPNASVQCTMPHNPVSAGERDEVQQSGEARKKKANTAMIFNIAEMVGQKETFLGRK